MASALEWGSRGREFKSLSPDFIQQSCWGFSIDEFVKGDFTKKSDIDLLARFSKPKSLLDLVRIERVLSEVLGRKTDLLTEASISPYLRDRIKNEMEVVYERAG